MAGKRFIDNQDIKEKLATLHKKQLELLLQRMDDEIIEPQEMRLIWEMVQKHNIGFDSVEDLKKKALEQASRHVNEIQLDDDWIFNNP